MYCRAGSAFATGDEGVAFPLLTRGHAAPVAYLFDLDGVLTPTAELHRAAWRRLFTEALPILAPDAPPYTDDDYFRHVDGRPRLAGIEAVLDSRGVRLPLGDPADPPGTSSVWALGSRKDAEFRATLAADGITPYPGSVRLLDALARDDVAIAVVTSSANAALVLEAAGLADRFGVVVDGTLARREGLAGKPAPDTYLRAAELVGAQPAACVVVEDAVSGVAAGRAGGFGLVLGVDRGAGADELRAAGADLVVDDLGELVDGAS